MSQNGDEPLACFPLFVCGLELHPPLLQLILCRQLMGDQLPKKIKNGQVVFRNCRGKGIEGAKRTESLSLGAAQWYRDVAVDVVPLQAGMVLETYVS